MLSLLALVGALLGSGAAATLVISRQVNAAYPPQGRFVEVAGGRVHLIERGPPPGEARATVVFLHGASGNGADPLFALGDRMAPQDRLIAVDRPGHGWSDRPGDRADSSPVRQAALIAQALDAAGVRRAVVAGHSFGGVVALALALERPDLVAGLVLFAPVSHPWPGGIAWYYHAAANDLVGRLFSSTIAVPAVAAMLEPGIASVFAPQPVPAGYVERSRVKLLMRPETFRANAQDVADLLAFVETQSRRYHELTMPVTIVTGDRDTVVSPTIHSRALSREIAGARLVVLPGVGHQPHYADPALAAREIEAMIGRTIP